jgi:3-hydroxy-9,10-secoandrosta-1,3,5(10)-triene-9,17-dione monooxygenase reductase component
MTMSSSPAFDQKEFRRTLGTFTTGVTIITARAADGTPVGVTANSFNSVSLDPPMVLWSLAKSSRSLAAFNESDHWAVHILSVEQDALSNRFAKSGKNKFDGVETIPGAGGVPLLPGCTARLQCKTSFRYEGGDHIIFVGEVLDFDRNEVPPLVFHGGRYAVATSKSAEYALSGAAPDASASFSENFIGYLLARAHFQFYSQVRPHVRSHGLTDSEYFLLTVLSVKQQCAVEDLDARFGYTGHAITPALVLGLAARGLVAVWQEDGREACALSNSGREVVLHVIAAAQAIASGMQAQLGDWETVALKNLLKQFIAQTDPGLAHPWDVRNV